MAQTLPLLDIGAVHMVVRRHTYIAGTWWAGLGPQDSTEHAPTHSSSRRPEGGPDRAVWRCTGGPEAEQSVRQVRAEAERKTSPTELKEITASQAGSGCQHATCLAILLLGVTHNLTQDSSGHSSLTHTKQ